MDKSSNCTGSNEVYKLAPYEPSASGFSDDDAAFLQENGFNAVRLGVIWSAVEPEPGVYDDSYLASIQQTIQMLHEHGIYVILDMHQDGYSTVFGGEGAPTWATQDGGLANPSLPFPLQYFFNPAEAHAWDAFWSNSDAPNGIGLENNYAQMLEHVANYFNGNPDVAGIEIMNEPSPGSETLATLLGGSHFDSQELTSFYDQAARRDPGRRPEHADLLRTRRHLHQRTTPHRGHCRPTGDGVLVPRLWPRIAGRYQCAERRRTTPTRTTFRPS